MKSVVIFGTGKMAELAFFYLTKDSDYNIAAFTVDKEYQDGRKIFMGLPLVAFEDVERFYDPKEFRMLVAIGYAKLNTIRAVKYKEAKAKGYKLASYICSKVIQWGDLEVGDNCFVFENQVFQPNVKIGNNVILWSGNHFGHDVKIGDHCFVASQVVLSGGVEVGDYSFIGVNATIRDGVKIGKESLIGAGAVILNNVVDRGVYITEITKKYPLDSEKFESLMDISKNAFKKKTV